MKLALCIPAILFLVLSIFSIVIMIFQQFEAITIAIKILLVAIWTWFLNYLCSKGHEVISWMLVLLPYLLFLLLFLTTYEMIKRAPQSDIISQSLIDQLKQSENSAGHS
jgi:ABC-type uncharacterized transport system permease subunit